MLTKDRATRIDETVPANHLHAYEGRGKTREKLCILRSSLIIQVDGISQSNFISIAEKKQTTKQNKTQKPNLRYWKYQYVPLSGNPTSSIACLKSVSLD